MDFRKLIDAVTLKEEVEIKATRRVQDTGSLTNFNIKDDDPFKLFTGLRNGGSNYSRDDVVKVHYMNDERLQSFLANSDGRGAVEVDADGNPVESPQTNAELDADSADTSAAGVDGAADAAATAGDPGEGGQATPEGTIRLSDGTEYNPTDEQDRNAASSKLDELIRKYNDLVGRMNESAPLSLRGYLKEYNLFEAFLVEALTPAEQEELRNVIADINALADGNILSEPNTAAARQAIADAPDLPEPSADDADSADSGTADPGEEAERASAASGDADANVDPGESETAGSLEAFASSGKGGLANDTDEVDAIKELQQYLTDLGFDPNGVDGKYGRGTIAAVKEFQKYFGAKEDGDAGPETIGKIIKLRSIRWGEGGSKTFVDWRNTMTRMEELIGKAGNNVDETKKLNSMSAILEAYRRLDEALSDQEAEELQGILDELQSAYEDGEFTAALPPNVAERFTSNFDAAKGVLADMGQGGDEEEPAADDAEAEEPAAEAGEGAYKVVTGSGQSRRYTVYDAEGNEVSNGRGAGPNLPTQEEYEAQGNQVPFNAQEVADKLKDAISGMGTDEQAVYDAIDQSANAENWGQVVRLYPEVYDDIYGDFSGTDLELVKSKLQNIGVTMPEEGQPQDPAGGEPDANGNVEPRPTDSGVQGDYARAAWDENYGETHNPDGTPKAGGNDQAEPAADSAADSADAGDPESGGEVTSDLEQRVARYEAMPLDTEEQIRSYMQALKDDEEVFNLLPQGDRDAINTYLGS